jgi:hypothetical protein
MPIGSLNKGQGERRYISASNGEGAVLEPGKVVEFSETTTNGDQGFVVELVDAVVNLTTGLGAEIAGVVDSTINTGNVGRLQTRGPANVRASASLAAGTLVVTSSINATNQSHVTGASESTAVGVAYAGAVVGRTLEDGPNATNATVQLTFAGGIA